MRECLYTKHVPRICALRGAFWESSPSITRPKRRVCLRQMISIAASTQESYAKAPEEWVLKTWREADAVCFDVDSTLCEDESIDELAAYLGFGEAVAALTAQAMGGTMKFEDTLAARLNLMQPSETAIAEFLAAHPPQLSEGIPELVQKLVGSGKKVFLVSGGFRVIINPVATMLGIPLEHVFANSILHKDGKYAGFDDQEFTSRSGGKYKAIMHIKEKYGISKMVMVGDGATDLEARREGGADIFIGSSLTPSDATRTWWAVVN